MTRNIFEGARGDMLGLATIITKDLSFKGIAMNKRRINTKLGKWMTKLYVANNKDLTNPQWVAITLLMNSLVEFILLNMISKKGRFKFPPIWKYPKVIGFFKRWLTAFFEVFSQTKPVIPSELMPKMPKKK